MQVAQTTGTTQTNASGQAAPVSGSSSWHLWANGSFSFHDLLDAVNPLQHLPIVSTIYREVTGDTIGNAARVVGDGLYGGVIGLAMGLVNALSVSDTGKDLGERAIAMVSGDGETAAAPKNGTVTVEALPVSAAPASVGTSSPIAAAAPAKSTDSGKSISVEAALAALPSSAPVDLPYFPGGSAAESTPQPARAPQIAEAPPASIPLPAKSSGIAISSPIHGFAIDTSAEGILAMRAKGHGQAPIPLQLSAGGLQTQSYQAQSTTTAKPNLAASGAAILTNAQANAAVQPVGNDFVKRMRDGIDKYNALLAKRAAAGQSGEGSDHVNGIASTLSGTGAIASNVTIPVSAPSLMQ